MSKALAVKPRIRLCASPTYDPPYDDERPPDWLGAAAAPALFELAASPAPPAPAPAAPGRSLAPAPWPPLRQPPALQPPAPQPPAPQPPALRPPALPDAAISPVSAGAPPSPAAVAGASPGTTAAAVRFVQTCLEIFNGYRPVGHFRALASPLSASTVVEAMAQALRRVRRVAYSPPVATRESLVKVRRMRTCAPRPGVAELAVVIGARTGPAGGEEKSWALAFRLEHQNGRWRCTAARLL